MSAPEFPRRLRLVDLGPGTRHERLEAGPAEREALARRFGLVALDALEAELEVGRVAAGVAVRGRVRGSGAQACVVSDLPVPVRVDEEVSLLFTPDAEPAAEAEVELSAGDLDVLPIEGGAVDLGEAVAQSFGLALDPYPRASDAELAEARRGLTSEEAAEARARAERLEASPFRVIRGDRAE